MLEQVNNGIKKRASGLAMRLIGTGLPERIRSTVVAMLGVTTAAGLALVLFLYQASWPIPSLGPLTLPKAGEKTGLQSGVSLGGAGSTSASRSARAARANNSGATATVIVVPAAAFEVPAATGSPTGDLAGAAPGVDQSQGAGGGSQPANPSPASPVRQPGAASPEPPASAPEAAPVGTPVSQPPPASEVPAVPAGEEPPIDGELPEEEPPLEEEGEEGEEEGEGEEEAPDEAAHPGAGHTAVPLVE